MNPERTLGEFEQIVLLAVLRLGDAAYGVTILDEIAVKRGATPLPALSIPRCTAWKTRAWSPSATAAPPPSAEAAPSASSSSPAKAATPWPARNPPIKACCKVSTCSTQNFGGAYA